MTFSRETDCPMHTSPLLQSNVLIATQWRLPICKTCTKGGSLISLNCNACPKTGSYRPFTSAISFIIFWDFLMFYQIITYKHGIYGLPHELPNDLKVQPSVKCNPTWRLMGPRVSIHTSQKPLRQQPPPIGQYTFANGISRYPGKA